MCDKNKLKIITNDTVEAILSVSKNVEKIILFGSQARGDSNVGSDIDILVVVDILEEQLGEIKIEMRNLASDISLEYDECISLIVVTRSEYESKVDTLFYQNIKRGGIVLFSI
jgi:predicted nucleotidyltransferase